MTKRERWQQWLFSGDAERQMKNKWRLYTEFPDGSYLSTVDLVLCHHFGMSHIHCVPDAQPDCVRWETMLFGPVVAEQGYESQWRHSSQEDAEKFHGTMVTLITMQLQTASKKDQL